MMRSIAASVENRCATEITVRCSANRQIAASTSASPRIEKTEQKIDERALAGTAFPGNAQFLAARNVEIEIAQHQLAAVGEADLFKRKSGDKFPQWLRILTVLDRRLLAQNAHQAA